MKIKRCPIDVAFSEYIRLRADWKCQTCDTYYPPERRQGLHCSHIFSRRHQGTRHDPDNAIAQCFGCHQRYGSDPVIFTEWAMSHLGPDRFQRLRIRAMTNTKFTKADKAMIHADIKKKIQELKMRRLTG